ncbi:MULTISPECIES: hypothetical protein [Streptomyces]|uniref:Uncharacterized protein n=2 Tax=Streptomyces TaxID=1883 RepID=A0A2N8P5R7_STRNR|nr:MULTISPECIES: hypothetical protein [Streptomyces]AJC57137.1 hypothetical protein GZL_04559 [Streptomyces sp. 769]PNE36372.1 hypothetical protein AOB60_40535 [Streptomyces noursei]QRX93330.1 hypothetical protein JNO44_22895 [Streptomyces noursei]UJB39485.1 hypothetical protein HRD51_21380 [Streptomyces sp. A1-5]WEB41421.1 hypothetical protein MOV08_20540 [Streptomyces yunnanensis]
MATFRNACGECRYTTPWLTESEAERRIIDHYARHHPHLVPGGAQQINGGGGGGGGCGGCGALLLGLFVLIVIISLAGQK